MITTADVLPVAKLSLAKYSQRHFFGVFLHSTGNNPMDDKIKSPMSIIDGIPFTEAISARETLCEGDAPETTLKLAASAAKSVDSSMLKILNQLDRKPDCQNGCSYCCHVFVEVTIPEQPSARHTIDYNRIAIMVGATGASGMSVALTSERLDGRTIELARGLKIALEDPSLLSTWRSSPHAFDGAIMSRAHLGPNFDRANAKRQKDLYRAITNGPGWKSHS